MTVSRKGWRRIVVGGQAYHWRATGTDWGIDVVVVTEAAFEPSTTSQQLRFTLDYDHDWRPYSGGGRTSKRQRAVVGPGVVRLALERALALSPPFTGGHGAPNIALPRETVTQLQSAARLSAGGVS